MSILHHNIKIRGERMKIFSVIGICLILVFILSSCVAGPNKLEKTPDEEGKVAGFWKGLWHGLIAPITFIISIFSKTVRFYEVHNNGSWYNFGFVLGAGLFLSGGILGKSSCKKKKG
jgi:uncharacterized BrkB/YihY/UPF0761 family membrane protein